MSRDIITIMEQMIECVPKDDPTSKLFLDALNKHLGKMSYVPPEQYCDIFQFERVIRILIDHFGETPPTKGWHKKVYDVWMNNNTPHSSHSV